MTKDELKSKIISEKNRLTYESFLTMAPDDFVFNFFNGLIARRFVEETEEGVYNLVCAPTELNAYIDERFESSGIKNVDDLDKGATISIRVENPAHGGFDAEVSSCSCFKDLISEMLKDDKTEQLKKIMLHPSMVNSFRFVSEVNDERSVFLLKCDGKEIIVGFEQQFKDVPELRKMFSLSEKPVFLVTIYTTFGFF